LTYINDFRLFESAMRRRIFIELIALAVASLRCASQAHAHWRSADFSSGDFQAKWQAITANQAVIDSQDISLSLPHIAESGAVVPMTIHSELEDIDRLYVLIEKNPTPLAAVFELSPAVFVHITARIKMAESCDVYVLARQGDHWLRCQQWVKVMVGGCGTG
jgi:sulfur-oxidizing protein SoxY